MLVASMTTSARAVGKNGERISSVETRLESVDERLTDRLASVEAQLSIYYRYVASVDARLADEQETLAHLESSEDSVATADAGADAIAGEDASALPELKTNAIIAE